MAADQAGMDRCVVLGRGYHYATAREWALKLKELGYVLADPYSAADFLHGPLALIEAGFPALVVAPSGATATDMGAIIERVGAELGASVLVVSDDADLRARGAWSIALPAGIPEWLMPIVAIVPGQLHALHVTLAKGRDPDSPRSIGKVTRTR
jgi:glucosamine--fructose-6-phosphate aminotransferase (isomerizing)